MTTQYRKPAFDSQIGLEFGSLGFPEERKAEKIPRSKAKTNNKVNPHGKGEYGNGTSGYFT